MVTRADVAKKAGVSVSAVSRTINRNGYVAKAKKEAILDAIAELGYRQNPISQSLKSGSSHQICFYKADLYNPYYMDLYNYMSQYADELGYTLFLINSLHADKFNTLLLDGMIIGNEIAARDFNREIKCNIGFPIVSNSYGTPLIENKGISYVDMDAYEAVSKGIEYLIKKGHHKIAFATPYRKMSGELLQARTIAYENAMQPFLGEKISEYEFVSSLSFDDYFNHNEFFYEEGIQAADMFIKNRNDATAILCFNDIFAMGMMSRLQSCGLKIPEDISIMGIDGISSRKYMKPLLTSVDMKMQQHAKVCIDILMELISGKRTSCFVHLKPGIVEGESVRRCCN